MSEIPYGRHDLDALSAAVSTQEKKQQLFPQKQIQRQPLSSQSQTLLNQIKKTNPDFSMNSYKKNNTFLISPQIGNVRTDNPNNNCNIITIRDKIGKSGKVLITFSPKILTPKIEEDAQGKYFIDPNVVLGNVCIQLKTQLENIASIINSKPFNPETLKTAYKTLKDLVLLKGIKITDRNSQYDLQFFLGFLNNFYERSTNTPLFPEGFLSNINNKNNLVTQIITDKNDYKKLVEKYYSIPSLYKSGYKKEMFLIDKTLEDLFTRLLEQIKNSNASDENILKATMKLYMYGNKITLPGTPQKPNNNDEEDKGYLQQKFLEMEIEQYKPSEKLKEIFLTILSNPENACITTGSEEKVKWLIPETLFTPIANKISLDRKIKANILDNRNQNKGCNIMGGQKTRKLNKNKLKGTKRHRKKTNRRIPKKQQKTHKRR